MWNFVSKPQLLYHDDGYYIFKFATLMDRDLVMQSRPYTFWNRLFILQNWTIDFEFNPNCLNNISLLVKFPIIRLGYRSFDSLSKLSSVVGRPMYIDKFTTALEHISYARILI